MHHIKRKINYWKLFGLFGSFIIGLCVWYFIIKLFLNYFL